MQEDDLNSESDSSVDSDGRWKSRKNTAKRLKQGDFDDYIHDEEIEQLLGPEEDYRDMTGPGLSLIDPEDDSLLDENESNSNMTLSDINRLKDHTRGSQRVEPTMHSQTLDGKSNGQSLDCDTSAAPVKEECVDVHISDHEREQVVGAESEEEGEDEQQLHSSRFKSERKMVSANSDYEHIEKVHHVDGHIRSSHSGQLRPNDQQRHQYRSYQNRRHPRRLSGDENMKQNRPSQGYRNHPAHRPYRPGSPPPLHRLPQPRYRWSPPHHYPRSPPHQRPPSPYQYHHHHPPPHHTECLPPYFKPPPLMAQMIDRRPPLPPPAYPPLMPDRRQPPPPARIPPRLVESDTAHHPPMPDRLRPPPSHAHPHFIDRQTAPLDFSNRPHQGYDRPRKDYECSSYDNYPHDYTRHPHVYDSGTDRGYVTPRVEPQKQISSPEQLQPRAPAPLFGKSYPLPRSTSTQAQPAQHAVSVSSMSHEISQSSFQPVNRPIASPSLQAIASSSLQTIASSSLPAKQEFNFNLAAAKQRVEAMQSFGNPGLKGNPFLKLQQSTAEPKTVVVKPVVRQQVPPPPPQEPQPLLKPLPRFLSTNCPAPIEPSINPLPVRQLTRQTSLDSALTAARPSARKQNRQFSVDTVEKETPRLVGPLRPLMDIKVPPELALQSAARTSSEPSVMSLQAAKSIVTQKTTPGTAMALKSKATLVVGDLSLGTSEDQLRNLFSEVGAIKQLILLPEENKAVVTFSDPRDALGCRRKFHRSPVNGALISVSFK